MDGCPATSAPTHPLTQPCPSSNQHALTLAHPRNLSTHSPTHPPQCILNALHTSMPHNLAAPTHSPTHSPTHPPTHPLTHTPCAQLHAPHRPHMHRFSLPQPHPHTHLRTHVFRQSQQSALHARGQSTAALPVRAF